MFKSIFKRLPLLYVLVAIGGALCDQWTKQWALNYLIPYEPVAITPFFDLLLTFNQGAAFSFLSNANGWQHYLFGGLAVVMSIFFVYSLYKNYYKSTLYNVATACLLSGAWGNLIDRITMGHVIDFIHLHIATWSWPIFNIADSLICIGGALMSWFLWKYNDSAYSNAKSH